MVKKGKIKKVKNKLRVILLVNKDLLFDLKQNDLDVISFLQELFKETLDEELKRHDREISEVENPIKVTVEIKTKKKGNEKATKKGKGKKASSKKV